MPGFFLTSAAKGQRIVLWFLACFAVSQLALSLYLDKRRPEIRDPLYGYRLRSLQARLAESPDAPLLLILGSSRVKYSVWPGAMKVHDRAGRQAVIYNFGIHALGHIRALMYLRRLLADGIRPDCLLVEVWPLLWTESDIFREARQIPSEDDLSWRDLPLVCRYFSKEPAVLRQGLRNNLLPISVYRSQLIEATVSSLLPRRQADQMARRLSDWRPRYGDGWFPIPEEWKLSTPEKRSRMEREAEHMKSLMAPLVINPQSDAALRELLEECRRRGIQTALILLPEHSRTRSWNSPQVAAVVRRYLGQLRRDYRLPIMDARAWVGDEFFAEDYLHMKAEGVPAFSERLGREVVQPLLHGTPPDDRVLFGEDAAQKSAKR